MRFISGSRLGIEGWISLFGLLENRMVFFPVKLRRSQLEVLSLSLKLEHKCGEIHCFLYRYLTLITRLRYQIIRHESWLFFSCQQQRYPTNQLYSINIINERNGPWTIHFQNYRQETMIAEKANDSGNSCGCSMEKDQQPRKLCF